MLETMPGVGTVDLSLENNPILAQQIAIIDDPQMPLPIAMQHQTAISEHPITFLVVPFQLGDAITIDDGTHSTWEVHQGFCTGLGSVRWRLGDAVVRHENSFLYLSEINSSIIARWLICKWAAICANMLLQSEDNLKLVASMLDIVAHNALPVKEKYA